MEGVEFWPLKRVVAAIGLSKAEVYRKVAAGTFPAQRSYRDNPHKKFWLSTEVQEWQRTQLQ